MSQQQQTTDILHSLRQLGETDPGLVWLLGLIAVVVLIGLLFSLARFVTDFSAELRLLNMEIARSEDERERRYYLHLRRKLWLSLIPFVRY